MDVFNREKRSEVMSRVRSKDTRPELVVRRALHRRGLRFRLHGRDLPGKPDIVFPSRRVVVFIHGCFWHRHPGCRRTTTPASNSAFWKAKFDATVKRDAEAMFALEAAGWTALVIWECEIRPSALEALYLQIIFEPVR
jgi:DNA mismatch endonuclease, patch repair protein